MYKSEGGTLGVVFSNDLRAGYCWFLRATPARAPSLRGPILVMNGKARRSLLKTARKEGACCTQESGKLQVLSCKIEYSPEVLEYM